MTSGCHSVQILSQQGHPKLGAQAHIQADFGHPHREVPTSLWSLSPSKAVLPDGQGELLGSRLCPEPLCLALSSYTSLQGFIDMGEIPPSSFCFRLSSPSSLSLFSQVRCYSPLIIFVASSGTIAAAPHLSYVNNPKLGCRIPDEAPGRHSTGLMSVLIDVSRCPKTGALQYLAQEI